MEAKKLREETIKFIKVFLDKHFRLPTVEEIAKDLKASKVDVYLGLQEIFKNR